MNLHSGMYVVVGDSRRTLDIGILRNATEGGAWWVWWTWANKATVWTVDPSAAFFESVEDAEDEADSRWIRLKPQVRVGR